jgi:hypothetical protein
MPTPLWDLWPDITSCLKFVGLVSVGRPLWREARSAICSVITQWSESLRTHNHALLSHLRLPRPEGPGSHIYIPQEQGGPVITLGTGFSLSHLLWLAGLQCRYSNPPPHWFNPIQSKVKVTLRLTISWSLHRSFKPTVGLVTRYCFLFEGCCLVFVWCSLWREVGSVFRQSQPVVIC